MNRTETALTWKGMDMKIGGETSAQHNWKLSQIFGQRPPGEQVQEGDIVSAIEFDRTGDCLAVGDRGGRVVIFQRKDGKHASSQSRNSNRNGFHQFDSTLIQKPEYQYKTEFQSHESEFDYLKSLEIKEKISKVRWCATPNASMFLLSTNDKTIKLWKIKEQKVQKVTNMDPNQILSSENALLTERSFMNGRNALLTERSFMNGREEESFLRLEDTEKKIANTEDTGDTRCRKVYAHDFNINSISTNSDGETFISVDDLRVNMWNLGIDDQCYNIIDIKPSNMEDLTDVITSAEFHPIQCNLLAYGSSRGLIRLVDLRKSALCDHGAMILRDGQSRGPKSFFTEIVASISDIKFSRNELHILSRDYINLKLWDVRYESSPVAVFKIHEHLLPKLSGLYDNDSIFDKFECGISGDGCHFATGSYGDTLCIFSHGAGAEEGITIGANGNRNRVSHASPRARRSSLSNLSRGFSRQVHENSSSSDVESLCDSKLCHLSWHPTMNLIACSSRNSLLLYYC